MDQPPDFISRQVLRGDYYFLDLEPRPSESLTVVCGGRETCDSAYEIDRKSFPFSSIEFVASGEGQVTLDAESFPLRAGTLFRYRPGIAHRIEVAEGSTLVKYFVDFAGQEAPGFWNGPWEAGRPLHVPESSGVQALFESLQTTGRRPGPRTARLCALLLEQIVLRTADEAVDLEASHSPAWRTYRRCREYLESNFATLRSLSEVTEACHVGEAWLCRLFQQFNEQSPYRYLISLKIAHAASLLADPSRMVKEIALEVGFEDPYHFSKVFKRWTGRSPEAFRTVVGLNL